MAWSTDPPQNLQGLTDVNPAGVGPGTGGGRILTWDQAAAKAVWSLPSAATTLASLSDVLLTAPAEGDRLTYETASSKWKNKPPSAGTGGIITVAPRVIGPLTELFDAGYVGKYTDLVCTDGGITISFDDAVVHDADTVLEALFNVMGADGGSPAKFLGGTANGPYPVVLSSQAATGTSGVAGTAMTHAQNVQKTITIPAGEKRTCLIAYAANPLQPSNPSACPTFEFLGSTTRAWEQTTAANNSAPRIFFAAIPVDDAVAAGNTTFKPNWTDYGGNGNVCSYVAFFIWLDGNEPTTKFEGYSPLQQPTSGTSATVDFAPAATAGNRVGIAFAFRRGNQGPTPIVGSGSDVTQLLEVTTGALLLDVEMRGCATIRPLLPGRTVTTSFALGVSKPHSTIGLMATPLLGSMLVVGPGGIINPEVVSDGVVGIIYNKHHQRVDLVA